MEEILGLGSFDYERNVPGRFGVEGRRFLYLSDILDEEFETIFKKVVRYTEPPLMVSGGAILEGCKLTTPNNQVFQAISYKGDLEGWEAQIKQGAIAFGIELAWIKDDEICLESGDRYLLDECKVEFN